MMIKTNYLPVLPSRTEFETMALNLSVLYPNFLKPFRLDFILLKNLTHFKYKGEIFTFLSVK